MFIEPEIPYKITTSAYAFTLSKVHNRSALQELPFESDLTLFGIELNNASTFAMQ